MITRGRDRGPEQREGDDGRGEGDEEAQGDEATEPCRVGARFAQRAGLARDERGEQRPVGHGDDYGEADREEQELVEGLEAPGALQGPGQQSQAWAAPRPRPKDAEATGWRWPRKGGRAWDRWSSGSTGGCWRRTGQTPRRRRRRRSRLGQVSRRCGRRCRTGPGPATGAGRPRGDDGGGRWRSSGRGCAAVTADIVSLVVGHPGVGHGVEDVGDEQADGADHGDDQGHREDQLLVCAG